ncbi:MAG TPA: hypothetical protein VGW39_12085 [Chthoniobacterales bacterium]|nr:hypothetical protein [Chthoniobacterales bacterium]
MKTSITCLLLALSLTAPALADTLKYPADQPFASITFPEDWEATVTGDMIAASNDEGDVLINVITTRPDMLGPSNDKAFALLKVKPDFDSYKDSKSTLNGMNVVTVTVDAKGDSGPMKLTLTSVEVTKDKGVMLIQRGEGVAANQEEITAILNSIAAVK